MNSVEIPQSRLDYETIGGCRDTQPNTIGVQLKPD